MATDPYVYPGTNTLKNAAGIRDSTDLQRFEAVSTAQRISELSLQPIQGAFDIQHLQHIHRYIFQDVYSWAGEFRTIDLAKQGEFWFCRPEFILQSLQNLLTTLNGERNLQGTRLKDFIARASYYMAELNAIHPFREGNGRAQREFIRELGLQAGFQVGWTKVTKEEMYSASIASFQKRDNSQMEGLIGTITTKA